MSSFRIVDHKIPCQHVREYPRALAGSQEDVLHLAVKQYIPLDNPEPQPGDLTIIGAHANAFPKELYEPLWDDIHARMKKHNFRIRSIWIADVAQQGCSGVLNEELLGNDPCWHDHPRDLLHMINLKRDEMPRPLIGIGHSMGGNNLVNLALIHPRLFSSLILIDPVIQAQTSRKRTGPTEAAMSTFRRDVWPSREDAAKSYNKSAFYQTWNPRVLDLWVKYGLRDTPTPIHPEGSYTGGPKKVTLTTTKHQEVFTFLRPNYERYGEGKSGNRRTHPDLNPELTPNEPFYRPEPGQTMLRLPEVRPSVLYIFGGTSEISSPEQREHKMNHTGVGVGGSGGEAVGRVKGVVFDGVGHLVAMEAVEKTADEACGWIGSELERYRVEENEFNKMWSQKSRIEKQTTDEKWKTMMGGPPSRKKPDAKPKL